MGDRAIPDNETIKTLESLGATINFIDIWLTLLRENFNARCDAYINAIKVMLRKYLKLLKYHLLLRKKSINS